MARKVRVSFETELPRGASVAELRAYLRELEWVGGCRDPDHDPFFNSIRMRRITIERIDQKEDA